MLTPPNPASPGQLRRRLWVSGLALSCIAIAVIAMNLRDSAATDDGTLALGHDLLPSYAAGELVHTGQSRRMYDATAMRTIEERVRDQAHLAAPTGSGGARGFGPWLNPPFFAWCFVPLSVLPYRTAAGVFLAINLLLLTAALALLASWVAIPVGLVRQLSNISDGGPRRRTAAHLAMRERRWNMLRASGPTWPRWGLLPLFVLTCMPFWQAMCHQQNTFISLLLLGIGVALWRQRRGFAAGCCIGLLFFKPQLAAAVALVLAIDLGAPAVAGLAVVGTALLVVNLLTLPGTLTDYLHGLPPILHWLQNELPYNWGRQATFQSFWRIAIQGQHAGDTRWPARLLWFAGSAVCAFTLLALAVRFRLVVRGHAALRSPSAHGFGDQERCNNARGGSDFSPSPGTPGEGRGEGPSELAPRPSMRSSMAAHAAGFVFRGLNDSARAEDPHPDPLPEYRERESSRRDRLISLTIIAMPLLMPYYMDYDLLLLAIPAVLFARQTILRDAPPRWVDRVTFWSWVALFFETQINPGLAGQTRWNLAVPIVFCLFLSNAARCWLADAQQMAAPVEADKPRVAA